MFDFKDAAGQDVLTLETEAQPLKRMANAVLVEEAKLSATADGLSTTYIDPANVMMGEIEAPADAFDSYEFVADDAATLGMSFDPFRQSLRPARMSGGDTVKVHLAQRQSDVWVGRAYGEDHKSTYHSGFRNLDPDSIREQPDLPDGWESVEIESTVDQLNDAVQTVASRFDHINVETTDDGLRIGCTEDTSGSEVFLSGDYETGFGAIYSKDYLTDMTAAVKKLKADDVTIELGTDVPIYIKWERDDGIRGRFGLAPRIRPDD